MSARRTRALVVLALAVLSAGALQGCREIVGVPGASSLSDIERPPPLCECGPLEAQPGGSVVSACVEAYASLPDFGEGDPAAPFGSKEELLASDCAVCREDDPEQLRSCFGQLLDSAEPGSVPAVGSLGSACESPGDCGSWACCSDGGAGSCCEACVGCSAHIANRGAVPLCRDDAPLYAALGECLCGALLSIGNAFPNACAEECGRPSCRPDSAACIDCLLGFSSLGTERCDAEAVACQSSAVSRPNGAGG